MCANTCAALARHVCRTCTTNTSVLPGNRKHTSTISGGHSKTETRGPTNIDTWRSPEIPVPLSRPRAQKHGVSFCGARAFLQLATWDMSSAVCGIYTRREGTPTTELLYCSKPLQSLQRDAATKLEPFGRQRRTHTNTHPTAGNDDKAGQEHESESEPNFEPASMQIVTNLSQGIGNM
jgi:hypothetical protein